MGIRGPVPNPAAEQRERKAGWTTLPNTPTTSPPPPLVGVHGERASDLWARWWATPMATMWAVWDADALERLLDLYEVHWAGDGANLAEMRQIEDRYGLTPAARRRLMWQVEGVDTPAKTPDRLGHDTTPAEARPRAGRADDPRLQVLAGGKKTG